MAIFEIQPLAIATDGFIVEAAPALVEPITGVVDGAVSVSGIISDPALITGTVVINDPVGAISEPTAVTGTIKIINVKGEIT